MPIIQQERRLQETWVRRADPDYMYAFSEFVWRTLLVVVVLGIVVILAYAAVQFITVWQAISADQPDGGGTATASMQPSSDTTAVQGVLTLFSRRQEVVAHIQSVGAPVFVDPSR